MHQFVENDSLNKIIHKITDKISSKFTMLLFYTRAQRKIESLLCYNFKQITFLCSFLASFKGRNAILRFIRLFTTHFFIILRHSFKIVSLVLLFSLFTRVLLTHSNELEVITTADCRFILSKPFPYRLQGCFFLYMCNSIYVGMETSSESDRRKKKAVWEEVCLL